MDWLGLAPAAYAHVTGLIKAPDLAAGLTLSKNDFIRSGARGASYLAYRKAIQEVVSRQLGEWGDRREGDGRLRTTRLERDLERVPEDLAEDFPLLRTLVDRRTGGQKRLPMPGRGHDQVPTPLFANVPAGHELAGAETPASPTAPLPEDVPRPGNQPPHHEEPAAPVESYPHGVAAAAAPDTVPGRRRTARYGLLVQFESRPGDSELARLVDSTIWINDAHPAYVRAVASRALGYHTALAVALALAPLAVDVHDEHGFITQFLAQWGSTQSAGRTIRRRRSTKAKTA
jgi:hypothetical protein